MSQTTGAISFKDCKFEYSVDAGSNWKDASGHTNNIKIKGFKRNVGEYYTADGDTPIRRRGKRKTGTVTFEAAYTETSGEIWADFDSAYRNSTDIMFRWSPKGGNSTNKRFTTDAGIVTEPVFPEGDVEKGDIAKIMCEIECSEITPTTI